jgi:hypothetical protein
MSLWNFSGIFFAGKFFWNCSPGSPTIFFKWVTHLPELTGRTPRLNEKNHQKRGSSRIVTGALPLAIPVARLQASLFPILGCNCAATRLFRAWKHHQSANRRQERKIS